MRRLTQLWPGLISRNRNDIDEDEQPLLIDENQINELEQSILETYKNLYWTRLITMDDFRTDKYDNHHIGPDIAEVVIEMYKLDADDKPQWKPIFDP